MPSWRKAEYTAESRHGVVGIASRLACQNRNGRMSENGRTMSSDPLEDVGSPAKVKEMKGREG